MVHSPLTTPEEAQLFLASMRGKSHQRESLHNPPSHLSSDGMDAWYLQQKQRERELRERRKEAEQLLRGYRGSYDGCGLPRTPYTPDDEAFPGPAGSAVRRDSHPAQPHGFAKLNLGYELEQEGLAQDLEEEKKDEEAKDSLRRKKRLSTGTKGTSQSPSESEEQETVWRDLISSAPDAKFPPAAGRYHLYCSYACPGSHRALIMRTLKGLEDVVSVTYVHPTWRLTNPDNPNDKHRGWVFGDPLGQPFSNTINRGGPFPPAYTGNKPDPHFDAFSIREIYEVAHDTSGKYTIPLLWDSKLNTIVNNESSDIAYMFNSCFNAFAANGDLDLYTEDNEEGMAKLNEVNEWLSPLMINGVYRCGFAKNQRAYETAIDELCKAFDHADDILQNQRYLTGNTLTDADIRLFVTLLRFDEVYAIYFRANARLVMLTPSLLSFCREIYQMTGVAATCDMEQIKAHFFGSHPEWNNYSVVPRGLGFMELLDMPHDREKLSQGLKERTQGKVKVRHTSSPHNH